MFIHQLRNLVSTTKNYGMRYINDLIKNFLPEIQRCLDVARTEFESYYIQKLNPSLIGI
jgi:hypothetical protein